MTRVDFALSAEHRLLQDKSLALASEFARTSGTHDRDATQPTENYERLRREGYLELSVPIAWGGTGEGFLQHTIAYEALGTGCPSTALSFNMHASVVMPMLGSSQVDLSAKKHIVDLVLNKRCIISGNYSEPTSTAILGERWLSTIARRADGGWRVTGRKMFASMIGAADYCLVMARPDTATDPGSSMIILIPQKAEGRSVIENWDVLGMRATRSDSLVLEDCWVPEIAVVFASDDMRPFRRSTFAWSWGSYTAVYLGVAWAAYDELKRVVSKRTPPGYSQSLAYHPDVRRHIAELSIELESARLMMYRSAWLIDAEGPTERATSSLYQAKYAIGEALGRITRVGLTLGGAHGIFKGTRLEQLFRDGAIGALQTPPSDLCLWNVGIHELGLNPDEVLPALRPEEAVRSSVG